MPAKSISTKSKQPQNVMSISDLQTHVNRTKAKQAQLEDFIHRAHEAKIQTQEPGHGDPWVLLDGEKVKNAVDNDEWVVVGKFD
jgi:hypothetical protein